MAAESKQGLDYFSLMVDFFNDEKIEKYTARFGVKGDGILLRLMCRIYSNSYYLKFDNDLALMVAKSAGDSSLGGLVTDCVHELVKRGFFDESIFNSFQVLTSKAFQRRYLHGAKRRNGIYIIKEYWLIELPNGKNVNIINHTVNISGQNVNILDKNVNICGKNVNKSIENVNIMDEKKSVLKKSTAKKNRKKNDTVNILGQNVNIMDENVNINGKNVYISDHIINKNKNKNIREERREEKKNSDKFFLSHSENSEKTDFEKIAEKTETAKQDLQNLQCFENSKDSQTLQNLQGAQSLQPAKTISPKTETNPQKPVKDSKPDFLTRIVLAFASEFEKDRGRKYVITNKFKNTSAASDLHKYFKNNPEYASLDTESCIEYFKGFFAKCMKINNVWLYENMTLPLIYSQLNQILQKIEGVPNDNKRGLPIPNQSETYGQRIKRSIDQSQREFVEMLKAESTDSDRFL